MSIFDTHKHTAATGQDGGVQSDGDVLSLEAIGGRVVGFDSRRSG